MEERNRLTIQSITEGDWYAFANYLKVRYAHNSRAYCINAVRPFFNYWYKRGKSSVLPDTIVVQRYQEMHRDVLDDEEYHALLNAIGDRTVLKCRDNVIVRLLSETGMRISELLAMDIADLKSGQECMAQVKTKKSNQLGNVMWSEKTNAMLKKWLGFRLCYEGDALFISCSSSSFGKRLTARSVERMFAEYVKEVTIKKITPHSLRHTKAHLLLKRGATAEEFNLLLRHKSWDSRFKYLRLSKESFKGMAEKYL